MKPTDKFIETFTAKYTAKTFEGDELRDSRYVNAANWLDKNGFQDLTIAEATKKLFLDADGHLILQNGVNSENLDKNTRSHRKFGKESKAILKEFLVDIYRELEIDFTPWPSKKNWVQKIDEGRRVPPWMQGVH